MLLTYMGRVQCVVDLHGPSTVCMELLIFFKGIHTVN